jgi:hypothetical protein
MFPRSDRDRDGSPAQTALTLSAVAVSTGPDATPPDPIDPGAAAHRQSHLTQRPIAPETELELARAWGDR